MNATAAAGSAVRSWLTEHTGSECNPRRGCPPARTLHICTHSTRLTALRTRLPVAWKERGEEIFENLLFSLSLSARCVSLTSLCISSFFSGNRKTLYVNRIATVDSLIFLFFLNTSFSSFFSLSYFFSHLYKE